MTRRFPQRLRRLSQRALVLFASLSASYLLLLAFPQPLFAYQLEHAGMVVHARRPIPDAMRGTLERVRSRLDRSSLFDATQPAQIFICEPQWVFALFARQNYRVGGFADGFVGRHVFLRESDMDHDRLIGPSGKPVAADRPLSYFIAHELTHIAIATRLGRAGYARLPQWVDDGYADYVARDIDLGKALAGLKSDVRELDPLRSGLYLRYQLMVSFLLNVRSTPLSDLLGLHDDGAAILRELRALEVYPVNNP